MFRLRLLIASLLIAALACLTPVSASAAARSKPKPKPKRAPVDYVVRAIDAARTSGAITATQAVGFIATWTASASATKRAPSAVRRAEVVAVRAYTTNLARRGGLTADRIEPALLSVKATTYVMRTAKTLPSSSTRRLMIPGEPVVFTYYPHHGIQFQPFETYKLAMEYLAFPLNTGMPQATTLAERMLELAVPRGAVTTWEYYFPFGGPATPWTSSMSQSLATEVFYRLGQYDQTDRKTVYTDTAAKAAAAFDVPPSQGGVAFPEGTGSWYSLYPFSPSERILNGHLQPLINLSRYARDTGSQTAAAAVQRGVAAVVPLLPQFDTGGWSRYRYGQEATLNYHDFQTSELLKLGKDATIPSHEVFQSYADRFATYRSTPPVLSIPADEALAPIIPALDGWRDTATLRFTLDKRTTDIVRIFAADGTPVRTLTASGAGGEHSVAWNGRTSAGVVVADGEYSVRISSTDVVGNVSMADVLTKFVVARDTVDPVLGGVTVAASGPKASRIIVRASDEGSGWIDASVLVAGKVVAKQRLARTGRRAIRVARPAATVRAGTLLLRDSSGNQLRQPIGPAPKA